MAKPPAPHRESVTTINRDGSRFFLHPADVSGRFTRWRRVAAFLLIAVYVLLPWIPINGYPAIFLDLASRRFHVFGLTFAAQDGWIAFFLITGFAFLLFYISAFAGRVWCGWACPHTVFLEHVFRRIERWIDGDAPARRALASAPWTPAKAFRRVAKHALFLSLSAVIAHILLSYFVSIPRLYDWMGHPPREHWAAFVFAFGATALIYFNFAWFREQLCVILCPYGRLQGALVDEHTVNVAYDEARGEPRGRLGTPQAGDCVDCHRCVQVCPTGIDIRQGLQLECVACTACIDACDEVMDRLGRRPGLIRYASPAQLAGRRTLWWRPRTRLYTFLLLTGMAVGAIAFARLGPFESSVVRMPGPPSYLTPEVVRNQFQVRILNKRATPSRFRVSLADPPSGMVQVGGGITLEVGPGAEDLVPLILTQARDTFIGPHKVTVVIEEEAGTARKRSHRVDFLGPDPRLLRGI